MTVPPALPVSAPLLEATTTEDPIQQFRFWFDEAAAAGVWEVNAMTLATVGADGAPSARIVLLKTVDERGFVFYTNRLSRKGRELTQHPLAALTFFWPQLQRQVRIEGRTSLVSDEESDAYFATRPRESQLGAWTSLQSEVAESRAAIDLRFAELTHQWEGRKVERPPHWGGFLVTPEVIEFWQARVGRLHDRLRYRRGANPAWVRERLWP